MLVKQLSMGIAWVRKPPNDVDGHLANIAELTFSLPPNAAVRPARVIRRVIASVPCH